MHGSYINFNLQETGRTVLFYAVASGMLDLAEKLLKQGADLNITDMVCLVNFWNIANITSSKGNWLNVLQHNIIK